MYVIVSPPGKFHVPRAARQARLRPARPAHTVIYCSTVSAALQRMDAQRECRCQIFVKCS
nr:MAG TPA: cysteine-rich protein [Caudoviricetes sp.]